MLPLSMATAFKYSASGARPPSAGTSWGLSMAASSWALCGVETTLVRTSGCRLFLCLKSSLGVIEDQRQYRPCWIYSTIEGLKLTVCMGKGAVEELAVERIIWCNKTVGGCSGGNLPTAFDYMNNACGIASDAAYPEVNNTQGRTHKCEWGGKAASVTSWKYGVTPCMTRCLRQSG